MGGSSGSAGSSQGGSAGTSAAGAGGTAGSAGNGAGGSGGASGSAGSGATAGQTSGGTGGSGGACSPTNVAVDFRTQGNVQRDQFTQSGVTIVGSSDLQLSTASSAPNGGLGVVGGLYDWSIDSEEFVTIQFGPNPATNVKYYVEGALDVDHDGIFGKTSVIAYGMNGSPIDTLTITDIGSKNVSALFGSVPITKLSIRTGGDGLVLGTLSFSACLE